jgi:hypothetical protein
VSPELEILRAPRRAFARLAAEPQDVSPLAACYRPAVALLTIGTAASISSTFHVSVALVASVTACWAFLVALQVTAACLVIPADRRRALGAARTIDLFFSGHAPWSLWLLGVAAWAVAWPVSGRNASWMLATMMIPLVWNAAIVFAFFRSALDLAQGAALRRTVAHQAITLGTGFGVFAAAVAIWPRIVGVFVR